MKTTVSFYQFRNDFKELRPNNFSEDGLQVLFDFLEDMEEQCAIDIEFDVIGLCCEYSEASAEEIADDYGIDLTGCEDDESISEKVMEYLNDNTIVCGETRTDTIVYQQF